MKLNLELHIETPENFEYECKVRHMNEDVYLAFLRNGYQKAFDRIIEEHKGKETVTVRKVTHDEEHEGMNESQYNPGIKDGLCYLSGVERFTKKLACYSEYNETEGFRFVIDGKTYECYEDPEDGYRSTSVLYESDCKCRHTFAKQPMIAKFTDGYDGEYSSSKTWMLTLTDPVTNKEVLQVGTENYNDWYPISKMWFEPENMAVNLGK